VTTQYGEEGFIDEHLMIPHTFSPSLPIVTCQQFKAYELITQSIKDLKQQRRRQCY
jgi:hypothetical protein